MIRRSAIWFLALVAISLAAYQQASAAVLLTTKEAIAAAFPGCEINKKILYLTAAEKKHIEVNKVELTTSIIHRYDGMCDGSYAGSAYFDTHRVRTLPSTMLIVVGPDTQIRHIEVISFDEPRDYLPPQKWYDQFIKQPVDEKLRVGKKIRAMTGATLSAHAADKAVQRVTTIHEATFANNAP